MLADAGCRCWLTPMLVYDPDAGAAQTAVLAHNTRAQFKQVMQALRELMVEPATTTKRPIGFVIPEDKSDKNKPKAAKARR